MNRYRLIIAVGIVTAIILSILDYSVEVAGFILAITILISYFILKKGLPKR